MYQLHTRNGLSYGATSPALTRMLEGGLIAAASENKEERGKPYSAITERLPDVLEDLLSHLRRPVLKDVESILRICGAALAIDHIAAADEALKLELGMSDSVRQLIQRLRPAVLEYASRAVTDRKATAAAQKEEAERIEEELGQEAYSSYPWMRAVSGAMIAKAEAAALLGIVERLSPRTAKRSSKR